MSPKRYGASTAMTLQSGQSGCVDLEEVQRTLDVADAGRWAGVVSELAMGAIHLAPLVVQGHDLGHLVIEQAVHGVATGSAVGQLPGGPALEPAPGSTLGEIQFGAGSPK